VGFPARRRDRPSESQASPRAEWYDRNPITKTIGYYATNVAPHSATVRATYTVPTGKKAFLDLISLVLERVTVATTVGLCTIVVRYNEGTGNWLILNARFQDNAVRASKWNNQGESGVLQASDCVDIFTSDNSTGGEMLYSACVKITEFDA